MKLRSAGKERHKLPNSAKGSDLQPASQITLDLCRGSNPVKIDRISIGLATSLLSIKSSPARSTSRLPG
jgi:hypothetical protein